VSHTSPDLIWAVIAVIAVLLVLSSSLLGSMIIYSGKIRKSERKFRTLFTRVFDALMLADKAGRIVDVNESACLLLGYAKEEFEQLSIERFIAPDKQSDLRRKLEEAYEGHSVYLGELEMVGNNGIAIHAEVGCTGLEIRGQTYILASLRDITDRKLVEDELRHKNIALREVLFSLEEEKAKIKKQISSTVDHVLMPSLDKLAIGDGSINMAYFRSLKENLQELASLSADMKDVMTKLSPRELEISSLTRNGLTAKEIAKMLNITTATVEKHKERIRKKLKIYNTKTNLATHLQKMNHNK